MEIIWNKQGKIICFYYHIHSIVWKSIQFQEGQILSPKLKQYYESIRWSALRNDQDLDHMLIMFTEQQQVVRMNCWWSVLLAPQMNRICWERTERHKAKLHIILCAVCIQFNGSRKKNSRDTMLSIPTTISLRLALVSCKTPSHSIKDDNIGFN